MGITHGITTRLTRPVTRGVTELGGGGTYDGYTATPIGITVTPELGTPAVEAGNLFEHLFSDFFEETDAEFNPLFEIEEVS